MKEGNIMKNLISKWSSLSLITRIVIGLILGAILGIAAPKAAAIAILGDLFVGALRAVAPVLVFVLVMSSLANAKEGGARNMRTVIILYIVSTFLGAFCGCCRKFFCSRRQLTLTEAAADVTPPSGVAEVLENLLMNVVANPVDALANANYIGILAWAVMFGIA